MELETSFGTSKPIVGMIHLDALPGAPGSNDPIDAIVDSALADARALADGGIDGLLVENFGDVPFYPDEVPKHTVAAMTRVATAVSRETELPLGINVLRNDATAALSIAAAVGGRFVRVNVHTGARVADQGLLSGRAHETMRLHDQLDADVAVLADLDVKHSAPLTGESYRAESFAEGIERGLADAVIVSGGGTGDPVDRESLREVVHQREELGLEAPIFLGSGVRTETVAELLEIADGAIVGTALKRGGETTAPVDRSRVEKLVAAADRVR